MRQLIIILLLAATQAMAKGKHALLIGISDYDNKRENPNEWANIHGANDVRLLAPLFRKQGFDVVQLTDRQATYANIQQALRQLTDAAQAGDIVYLHFSCHGQPFEDLDGDEDDGWDEALIPFDARMQYRAGQYEGEHHLLDDELALHTTAMRRRLGPEGMLYVVLDASQSGEARRGDDEMVRGTDIGFSPNGKPYEPQQHAAGRLSMKPESDLSPVAYVEACRADQVNMEIAIAERNEVYGPLSYFISQEITRHRISRDPAWLDKVSQRMADHPRVRRRQQMVLEITE